jgi:hypothetical protein
MDSHNLSHTEFNFDAKRDSAHLSIEEVLKLCATCEEHIDSEVARKSGAIFTPAYFAESILKASFARSARPICSIADISCGAGMFLAQSLILQCQEQQVPANVALSHLYGIDRNPHMVLATRRILLMLVHLLGGSLKEATHCVEQQILVGDSLIDHHVQSELFQAPSLPCSLRDQFPEIRRQGGFQLIVGNPPFGLSRSSRISPTEVAALRASFSGILKGRINTATLFIERSYQLLRDDGEFLLIVPNSWLAIDEGKWLRERLVARGTLRSITSLARTPFPGVGVEVILVHGTKTKNSLIEIRRAEDGTMKNILSQRIIETASLLADAALRIPLDVDEASLMIVSAMEQHRKTLTKEGFAVGIGLQPYGVGKGDPPQTPEVVASHPFGASSAKDPLHIPLLMGRDVRCGHVEWSGSYLRYGPWLAECPPRALYSRPRVLVREILAPIPYRLHCAYTEKEYVYSRPILHIHGGAYRSAAEVKAIAAILSSKRASTWITVRGRKSQRTLFPKVLVADLKEFPIPLLSSERVEQLCDAYEQIARGNHESLEELVDALYGIGDKE